MLSVFPARNSQGEQNKANDLQKELMVKIKAENIGQSRSAAQQTALLKKTSAKIQATPVKSPDKTDKKSKVNSFLEDTDTADKTELSLAELDLARAEAELLEDNLG